MTASSTPATAARAAPRPAAEHRGPGGAISASPASARPAGGLQAMAGNGAVSELLSGRPEPGAGHPLAPAVRSDMEARFGENFSSVRVSDGAPAARDAASLRAKAYTVGEAIVFADGCYAPETFAGRRLLAHELAHVVQQRRGGSPPSLPSDAALERGAEAAARKAVTGGRDPVRVKGSSGVGIARQPDDEYMLSSVGSHFAQKSDMAAPGAPFSAQTFSARPREREAGLRFGSGIGGRGAPATTEALLDWAVRENVPEKVLLMRVRHSHEFDGDDAARNAAAAALAAELKRTSLDKRRLEQQEKERRREETRRQQAAEAARQAWLRGEGPDDARLLDAPKGVWQQRKGDPVHFETFDREGNLRTKSYADPDVYGEHVRQQAKALITDCNSLTDEVKNKVKADNEVVRETYRDAAWYQKPGLDVVGLGYTKLSIAQGLNSIGNCKAGIEAAKRALSTIDSGRGTPAAQALNDAKQRFFTAKHWLGKMDVEKTAGTVVGAVLPGPLKGESASAGRAFAANLAAGQVGKAISTGHASALGDISATDLVLAAAGTAHERVSAARAGREAAEQPAPEPPAAATPKAPPAENAVGGGGGAGRTPPSGGGGGDGGKAGKPVDPEIEKAFSTLEHFDLQTKAEATAKPGPEKTATSDPPPAPLDPALLEKSRILRERNKDLRERRETAAREGKDPAKVKPKALPKDLRVREHQKRVREAERAEAEAEAEKHAAVARAQEQKPMSRREEWEQNVRREEWEQNVARRAFDAGDRHGRRSRGRRQLREGARQSRRDGTRLLGRPRRQPGR